MEFGLFIQNYVPRFRREAEPDAEHNAIVEDAEAVVAADRAGFKYAWLTEHHCDFGEGWVLGRARPIEELHPAAM